MLSLLEWCIRNCFLFTDISQQKIPLQFTLFAENGKEKFKICGLPISWSDDLDIGWIKVISRESDEKIWFSFFVFNRTWKQIHNGSLNVVNWCFYMKVLKPLTSAIIFDNHSNKTSNECYNMTCTTRSEHQVTYVESF